ncbi:MAG: VWA domain-containing protein, partial [Clostridia bacterium]|nr:VWA domain-containing protein [Clostridia bacterium]
HNMNGLIFYEDEETARLVKYTGNEAILTLPDNYNGKNYSISNYAFYNCNSQMTVVIPENITSTEEFEGVAGIIVGFNDYTAELYGVIIIIDRSGSMDETLAVGTTRENRLWWAKQGAMACLDPDILSKTDYIGIMTLDSYNEIILPLTPYQQEAKILAAIDSIEEAGGGTIATNALNSARQQLLAQKNINKYHIIVITDGDFADLDTAIEAAQTNYANGITMSIVKIGESDTGTTMSLRLAAAGNGGDPDGNLTPYEKYVYRDDNRIVLNMREIIKNLR